MSLNVGIGHTLAMKKIAGSNPDGVGRPPVQDWVCSLEIVDLLSNLSEEKSNMQPRDETMLPHILALTTTEDAKKPVRGAIKAHGAEADTQRHSPRAELQIFGVLLIWDDLIMRPLFCFLDCS